MAIELKVGEWYETADRERVKVIANIAEHIPPHSVLQFIAVDRHGNTTNYQFNGMCRTAGKEPRDIVKQLRDCTGWNWQEPKWRPAKAADLDPGIPVDCRVKDKADACWTTGKQFVGYNVRSRLRYRTHEGGSYEFCEVLDAASVPPSAECEVCGGTGEADSGAPTPYGGFFTIPCECLDTKHNAAQPSASEGGDA